MTKPAAHPLPANLEANLVALHDLFTINGHQCCVLDLPCCIPPRSQEMAVADVIHRAIHGEPLGDHNSDAGLQSIAAARGLLSVADLVPPGVGKGLSAGYAKWLCQTPPFGPKAA